MLLSAAGAILVLYGGIFGIVMAILTGWSPFSQAALAAVVTGIAMMVVSGLLQDRKQRFEHRRSNIQYWD